MVDELGHKASDYVEFNNFSDGESHLSVMALCDHVIGRLSQLCRVLMSAVGQWQLCAVPAFLSWVGVSLADIPYLAHLCVLCVGNR